MFKQILLTYLPYIPLYRTIMERWNVGGIVTNRKTVFHKGTSNNSDSIATKALRHKVSLRVLCVSSCLCAFVAIFRGAYNSFFPILRYAAVNCLRLVICFLLLISTTNAEIKLPSIISNNMVIQQNAEVPIWGWADKGEQVKVKVSWDKNIYSATAGADGKWKVILKSPEAGGNYEIEIEGENKIIIKDVLAGEVWLASGQSNMAATVKRSENGEEAAANADYPEIRLFHIDRIHAEEPQTDCKGEWLKCTPETVKDFSAVAYFFGREIYEKLNVPAAKRSIPMGLISSSKGGSPIEAWISGEAFDDDSMVSTELFDMWEKWEEEYPEDKKEYYTQIEEWKKAKEEGKTDIKKPSQPTSVDMIEKPHRRSRFLYNAMIAPIIPYVIKGVIWYQGENNTDRPIQYRKLFPLLISDWREQWDIGDFPFYYVQLATYRYKIDFEDASLLREAQLMTMDVPNTGMAVTVDIGDVDDIHPRNKLDVGKRLSLWALAKTYGFDDIVYSGPIYKSMKIEGNKIRLFFDYTGSGLMKKGEELTHFEIAGKDKEYKEAVAVIEDSTVVVYNPNISEPVAVRFSWRMDAVPNLYNKEGLPAAPFRTDDW